MFTLYNAPQSTCSQRVRFVLNAKKISFAEIKLDLLAGDQLKPGTTWHLTRTAWCRRSTTTARS